MIGAICINMAQQHFCRDRPYDDDDVRSRFYEEFFGFHGILVQSF